MAALGPDCDLELPPEGGTPSLGPDLASSADGATIAYASRSTVVLVDAPGVGGGGRPRALKLQEDGCVQQLRWVGPVCGAERLVAAAQSSVQVWSADGSLLCLCWALPAPPPGLDGPFMACCVAAVAPAEAIYVGASSGDIFVFSGVGDSFSYKQTVRAHDRQVCALASNDAASPSVLVSGDATGEIRAWDAFSMSTTVSIRGAGFAVTSLLLGEGTIVAGYETGHVRVFDLQVRGSSRPPNCEILLTGIPLCNVSLLATKVKWRATDYRRGGGGGADGRAARGDHGAPATRVLRAPAPDPAALPERGRGQRHQYLEHARRRRTVRPATPFPAPLYPAPLGRSFACGVWMEITRLPRRRAD